MPSDRTEEIVEVLRRRLTSGLHLGRIRAGARLPSVRTVAREFGVHQRVALAAYRELEQDGLVELRERSGVYVREARVDRAMLPKLSERLVDFLVEALALGVPAPDVPEHVRRCLETLRLRAACIECNADQIDSLCEQLRRGYGFESTGVELHALGTPDADAALRRADLLVTTSFHIDAVRDAAERVGRPWLAVALRADVVAEITRALSAGPVYFVATDPRFGAKAQAMFATVPGGENLRALIVGRDDLGQVPADAPTYVMRRASERLEEHPFLARVPPLERSLSLESARELLRFVVRANMAALAALREREDARADDRDLRVGRAAR